MGWTEQSWNTSWTSFRNTEATGAITVRVQGNCRRKHWSSELRNQWELGWKGTNGKRQDSLVENRHKQWELLATHSGYGWMQGTSENCNSITNPELLFHTG